MKLTRFIAVGLMAAMAFAATACTVTPTTGPDPGVGPPPIVSTSGTLADERALAHAENAFTVAASAYLAADRAGLMSPEVKERARAALLSANEALRLAHRAREAGEAETLAGQIAAAGRFVATATALIPAAPS